MRIRKTPVSAIHFLTCNECGMGIGATSPSECVKAFDEHYLEFHTPQFEIGGSVTHSATITV